MTTNNNKKSINSSVQKAQTEKQDSKDSKNVSPHQQQNKAATPAGTARIPTNAPASTVKNGNMTAVGATVLTPVQFFEAFGKQRRAAAQRTN